MDDKDKCRDTEDYMEKSLRFCVAKCLTKKYTYATPSSLETIQNLAIQYIKEIGKRAQELKEKEEEEKEGKENDEEKREGTKTKTKTDTELIINSLGNLMTPTNWDTTTATTSAMLAGWRQDHFSFDFRVGRFINHIVLNAQEVSEPYHPLSEHVAAQTQAIREAEAQAQVPGRRFKHRFPYTPQYPPPITYGTTPGSIKRAESAALMNERPKKKSKSKRSQKKSAQSQSQSQLQLQSQQSAEEKKAEQKGSTDVHIDDNNNNNNSNSTEKALKDPTQNAQN